jgi:hypothetical protein
MWRWGIAVVALGTLLAGCDQAESGTASAAPQTHVALDPISLSATPAPVTPTSSATPTPTPTPSSTAPAAPTSTRHRTPTPTPTPPPVAGGANVAACANGACEVEIGPGTAIPLPASAGVHNVKVTSVANNQVTITGQDSGNFGSGWCTGQCQSIDTNGNFTVTLGPNSTDVENGMSVAVGPFDNGRVTLKFSKS